MKQEYTRELVFGALGIALVFISTMFLKLPNSIGGYLNLGDGFILLFSSFLGPFASFMVGGAGSAFADIAGGYGSYALATILIKGFEALLISVLVRKGNRKLRVPAYILGSLWMIAGYYVTDSLISASWLVGLGGIIGNVIQAGVGIIIALCAAPLLQRLKESKGAN